MRPGRHVLVGDAQWGLVRGNAAARRRMRLRFVRRAGGRVFLFRDLDLEEERRKAGLGTDPSDVKVDIGNL